MPGSYSRPVDRPSALEPREEPGQRYRRRPVLPDDDGGDALTHRRERVRLFEEAA